MQVLDVLLYRVYELSLIFLNSATYLSITDETMFRKRIIDFHTFGLTNNALNLEKTRNISLAFLAVPSLSRSRAMI